MIQERNNNLEKIISSIVDMQGKIEKMPKLSDLDFVKFENEIAIDQLYNSSKLEGTQLTKKAMENAVFGYEK